MIMKKTLLAAGAVLALSSSFTVNAAENDKPQYLSDWWHQSVNVVGSYHTRFGPQIRNDTYLEYEAFAKKDWFDFYGYMDAPVFFGGNTDAKGIWNHGSPLFMEIEPRFSIDKLTGTSGVWSVQRVVFRKQLHLRHGPQQVRSPEHGIWVWVQTLRLACR